MATTAQQIAVDVVVVGSGAAGLTAALAARAAKASVLLLEKASTLGGATAVSGGVIWVPCNHHMAAAGIADSRAEAIEYIRRLSDGKSEEALIEAFVDAAPTAVRFVEATSPLRFQALPDYADYYAESPGGKAGGRSLDPGLFDTRELGAWQAALRRSPVFSAVAMTVTEFFAWRAWVTPLTIPFPLVLGRAVEGWVGYGGALAGGLLKAALDAGVELRLDAPVRDLLFTDGGVAGVRVGVASGELEVLARRGVILASGGFEWSRELRSQFLGGVVSHPLSPPANQGDGLRLLMSAGAALGNMSEAWWCPALAVPGEEYDGAPFFRGEFTMRALPHSLMVNRQGERFVNEALDYNDLMKACFRFDPARYERPNLPAWLLFDGNYTSKYPVLSALPGMPLPEWIPSAPSLPALAEHLGIDADGLAATVARFNADAAAGVDTAFRRGEALYDRVYGDAAHAPNPTFGPLAKPPYYALELFPGTLGTKGGALVDRSARVLRPSGEPIPGLYAAGNAMAGFSGAGYPGAGATLAAALTFGYLAGGHAAGRQP